MTRISKRIALLAVLNGLVCLTTFLLLRSFGGYRIDWAYLLISTFACLISGFVILYYFYYVLVTGDVNRLSEKIRSRFLVKEIPQKYNLLEEEDGIARLEERVDLLIDLREKEAVHFENLDSYRKEYIGNVSHELKPPSLTSRGMLIRSLTAGWKTGTSISNT
jgi:two-component system phosphate regulon sensor histidine kinase PhoR